MSYKYLEINGVNVLRRFFTDAKTEQEFMKMFPKNMPEGFVTVHKWQPGTQTKAGSLNGNQRAEERYISAIDLFIAPIVKGKPDTDLGAIEPGKPVAAPVNLEVPEELKNMKDADLLTLAPQIGGCRVNNKMPRNQILAQLAIGCQKNPKNWESIRQRLLNNAHERAQIEATKVTA